MMYKHNRLVNEMGFPLN